MSTGQGYSITTMRFRLRCSHPEWLVRTQELYDRIVKFYYDLFLAHEELWGRKSQETLRALESLSLSGKEKRKPETPLPWDGVPAYFRRAAVNGGIAAAKSFLARKTLAEKETGGENGKESDDAADPRDSFGSCAQSEAAPKRGSSIPASQLRSPVVYYSRMYRDFSPEKITLRVWDGENWRWMGCRLVGRKFPDGALILSPSVVLENTFFMLHVPVKMPVEDISPVKDRLKRGGCICALQFSNGNAFAAATVSGADGKEIAVKFFNGGDEYRHHCAKLLDKIRRSRASLGEFPEGPANRKYWMHLKHLREYYAHQVSREILSFCEENSVGVIILPKYKEEYTRKVMRGAGNWSPLHLSTRIRRCLRYKAWQAGIIVIDVYAGGTGTVCAKCGQPLEESDEKSRECVCVMGHRGNRYLNTARNLAAKCRELFLEKDFGGIDLHNFAETGIGADKDRFDL